MRVKMLAEAEDALLSFVVILAKCGDKIVLCRHRDRSTWEFPGGHREIGETVDAAARRELWEETGALDFDIEPLCPYAVTGEDGESFGMLYFARIRAFEELRFEIAETMLAEALPDNWTYPQIQPALLREAERRGLL